MNFWTGDTIFLSILPFYQLLELFLRKMLIFHNFFDISRCIVSTHFNQVLTVVVYVFW